MKSNKLKNILLSSLVAGSLLNTSCSNEDDDYGKSYPGTMLKEGSVSDVILKSSMFSNLAKALETTNTLSALQGNGPYTVFIPSNKAFQNLLDSNIQWEKIEDIPKEALENVVKYHVVSGEKINAENLTNSQKIKMLNDEDVTVSINAENNIIDLETVFNQDAEIVSSNIKATNGVLHLLDEVMLTEDIVKDIIEVATENSEISMFLEAVTATGLTDILKKEGAITVLAPNNDAFTALLNSNPVWNSISDIPTEELKEILLFHVLPNYILADNLTKLEEDAYEQTSAKGPEEGTNLSLLITKNGDQILFNEQAKPVSTDVLASNGTIHVIDKVMKLNKVLDFIANNDDFSSLNDALRDSRHTTDFISFLSGNGPFTIFTPNNAAFKALLDSNDSWNSLGDIPIEVLDKVLKYHVVNDANVLSTSLKNNQEIEMLGSGKVTVELTTDGAKLKTDGNTTPVTISKTDVQNTNGVLHVVNEVLLPNLK